MEKDVKHDYLAKSYADIEESVIKSKSMLVGSYSNEGKLLFGIQVSDGFVSGKF
jgi:hypothetical protein